MPIQIKTLTSATVTLTDEELTEAGHPTFRGAVITPQDEAYEAMRVVENRHIDRRPAMIVRCAGVADVVDAVNLARQHELLLAVRGGGHHVAGHASVDGGLVIDLRDMRSIWVEPETRLVHVQGGATWGDVDRETQAFGLAVPGGIVSTTGVAGLTLSGGLGWLHRKWGLACDNLAAVDLVTAEGKLVHASARENDDLFWGLRGGGGNFGVVVRFTFEAKPLGPIVAAAPVFYQAEDAPRIMPQWRDFAASAPDEVTTRAVFWTVPAVPGLPPVLHDRPVFIVNALYAGDPDTGARVLEPLRHFGTPILDMAGPMPFRSFQSVFDALLAGLRSYWKSTYLKELSDEAVDLIIEYSMNRPDPKVLVHVPVMGGATGRIGARDTAFGDRSAPWLLSVDGNWTDPTKADDVIRWVRSFIDEAKKLHGAGGTYLNFSADPPTEMSAVQAQYGENLPRLVELKRKYDPNNQFRVNNNIVPSMEQRSGQRRAG